MKSAHKTDGLIMASKKCGIVHLPVKYIFERSSKSQQQQQHAYMVLYLTQHWFKCQSLRARCSLLSEMIRTCWFLSSLPCASRAAWLQTLRVCTQTPSGNLQGRGTPLVSTCPPLVEDSSGTAARTKSSAHLPCSLIDLMKALMT